MRPLLAVALYLILLGIIFSCGSRPCARCAQPATEWEIRINSPYCLDEFATEIHNNCFKREC